MAAWSESWAQEERTTRLANGHRRLSKLIALAGPLCVLIGLELYLGIGFALNALGLNETVAPMGAVIALGLALLGPAAVLITSLLLRRSQASKVNKLILASGVGLAASLPACLLLLVWIGSASIL